MKVLKNMWNSLLKAENAIMMTANIGVVILVFISVLMRYILQKNTGGMEELIVFVATWIYFVGGAIGSYENSHITADFLSVFIHNEKAKEMIGMLRHLITFIILVGASYCAVELLIYSITNPSATSILKIPMIVIYLPIFVGIFLMTFYTVVHFVEALLRIIGKGKKEVEA